MTTPIIQYDETSDAAYIRFSPEDVLESEEVSDGIVLDFDADGRIVGMEVLEAARRLSPAILGKAA